jgi:hypothetical protein
MKIKALALGAATALSLGAAGAANAASPAPAATQIAPAIAFKQADNGAVQARYRGRRGFHGRRFHGRRFRGRRRFHDRHSFLRFRFFFDPDYRYGYYRPWGYYGRCRRFYYLGFVRGFPYYRHLYYRYCQY